MSGNQILVSHEDPFCGQRIFVNPDNYNDGFSDQWQLQMMRAAQRIPQTQIPRQAKSIVDLYDDSDDWIPIYDSQHYLVSIWQSAIAVISTRMDRLSER